MGVYTALGIEVESFWRRCLAGDTEIAEIPARWRTHGQPQCSLYSPVPAPECALPGLSRLERLQNDPVSLLAQHAAGSALEAAGLTATAVAAGRFRLSGVDPDRTGVVMGTGVGGIHTAFANHSHQILGKPATDLRTLAEGLAETAPDAGREILDCLAALPQPARFHPMAVAMFMPNAVSAGLGIRYGLHGPNWTVTLACAAGTAAIGQAFRAVRGGLLDLALTGGAEYLDDEYGGNYNGFDIARTLVKDCTVPGQANRPFDAARTGFLFSTGGAACLVIESLAHAEARGAPILAEILGYGETFDAHHVTAIDPSGTEIRRMMGLALADARVRPEEVDYVNAHGTGTLANDITEAAAIAAVLGPRPAVNATKSLLGHTIGASGAIEAVVTLLTLRDQRSHPCRNLVDPIADLRFVRTADPLPVEIALTQSFAFGGHNTGLVLRRFRP
jgi:3-oxoacyl-[acyl-carrier-protein] synthase II